MRRKLSLTLAFALLVNLIIGFTAYSEEREAVGGDDEVLATIETIMNVLQLIRRNYVDIDKVSTKELLEGALNGMTEKLDPYSLYLPPTDLKSFVEDTEGSFGGIGININTKDGKAQIVSTTPEAPAEKAGLRRDDECDQQAVNALRSGQKLQKQAGTGKIRVFRNNARTCFTCTANAQRAADSRHDRRDDVSDA